MSFAKFKHVQKTGVKHIDDEHEKLINMINELLHSFSNDSDLSTSREVISKLETYADYHFKSEEKYLKEVNYKYLEKHKDAHEHFKNEVSKFKEQMEQGDQDIANKILTFLSEWIHNCQLREIEADDK